MCSKEHMCVLWNAHVFSLKSVLTKGQFTQSNPSLNQTELNLAEEPIFQNIFRKSTHVFQTTHLYDMNIDTLDMYFLDKGALIIGFADMRPLIQRALL